MLRKTVLIGVLALLPAAVFAQVQIGPTAYYNFPLADTDEVEWDTSNFTFGADSRIKFGPIQAQGLGLYTAPSRDDGVNAVHVVDLHTNIGVAFDVLLFRFGAGFGPSFSLEFGDGAKETAGMGTNGRLGAELMLGDLSVGLNYLMRFPFNFSEAGRLFDADRSRGLVGASLLFSL